jgi:hypothetical protein
MINHGNLAKNGLSQMCVSPRYCNTAIDVPAELIDA